MKNLSDKFNGKRKVDVASFEKLEDRNLMSGMAISTVPVETTWVVGGTYSINVNADSTAIPDKYIKSAEWDFTVPSGLLSYLTFNNSSLPSTNNPSTNTNDFFYNVLMTSQNRVDSTISSGELDDNIRLKDASSQGVLNKSGILGTYNFTLSADAPVGDYNFGLHSVTFYDTNAVAYKLSSSNLTVTNNPIHVVEYLRGDMNGDNLVNNQDIATFVQALTGWTAYEAAYPNVAHKLERGDVNIDGAFNNADINPFCNLLASGAGAEQLANYISSQVPEPTTLALVGAGAVALAARKVRQGKISRRTDKEGIERIL